MLSLLEQLQCGLITSKSFMLQESTRRLYDLQLSRRRDMDAVHSGGVNALDIESIENRYLISGDNHGNIAIYDLFQITKKMSGTCKCVCKVKRTSRHTHDFGVDTLQWYPFDTGMFTSSSMDETLKVWDTTLLRPAETLKMRGKVYRHHQSTVATQHNLIATAMTYPHVVLVDIKSGSQCHELRGHRNNILSVRWSPTAEYLLASGGSDNKILLWDIRSAKSCLQALDQYNKESLGSQKDVTVAHNGMVNGLCFSPDGLYLVSFGTDHRLRVWDVAMSKNALVNFGRVQNDSQKHVQIDLCYDTAVPRIFVPSNNRITMYKMFSGYMLDVLIGHYNDVKCCSYRSYYHELYSGGYDRNLLFYTPDVSREMVDDEDGVKRSDIAERDRWSD